MSTNDKLRTISKDHHIFAFGPENEAVMTIDEGKKVKFETQDAFSNQINSEEDLATNIDFSKVNPATGPLAIKQAEKGDTLKISIEKIQTKDEGVVTTTPGHGVLGDEIEEPKTRICKIKDDKVIYEGIEIPYEPMIGVIGLASQKEIPCGTPDKHGGNMDTKFMREGANLYLPVQRKAGLLSMGDLHATMGDGEICVTGCEIPGEVTIKPSVIKEKSLKWPILETEENLYLLVSKENLDDSVKEAVKTAVGILKENLEVSWQEAYMFTSLATDLEISQVVDPKKTVRIKISKEYLDIENIF